MGNKYQRNFLTKVIARIDFLSPMVSLQDVLLSSVSEASLKYFPIPEPKDATLRVFSFGPEVRDIQKSQEISSKEWHFFAKDRDRHLLISRDAMFVESEHYQSWDDYSKCFLDVCDALYDNYKDLQIKRLGLRFINNIEIPGLKQFQWNAYLNSNLLSIFKVPDDKSQISRAFHNLELNSGSFYVRFQYGMHNPDYPAPIKKRIFILDFDAYATGSLAKEDLHQTLPLLHEEIVKLFENSITERLRGIMNVPK